jgi:hypothetical protein
VCWSLGPDLRLVMKGDRLDLSSARMLFAMEKSIWFEQRRFARHITVAEIQVSLPY